MITFQYDFEYFQKEFQFICPKVVLQDHLRIFFSDFIINIIRPN